MDRYSSSYAFWRQFLNCHVYPVGTYCAETGSFLQHCIQNHVWECFLKREDIPRVVSQGGKEMARLASAVRGGDVFLAKTSGNGVVVKAVGIVLMKASPIEKDGGVIGYRVPVEWVLNESKTIHNRLLGNLLTTIGDGAPITSPVWQTPEHKDLYESQILRARARFLDTHGPSVLSPVTHM